MILDIDIVQLHAEVDMIPPVSPSVLATNPQFATLHKHLTTHVLNSDASTRSISEQHEPTEKKIRKYHVQAAKQDILRRSLHDIVASSSEERLPPDLRELILIIADYISEARKNNLAPEAYDLLVPEIDAFSKNLDIIGPVLSQNLRQQTASILHLTETQKSSYRDSKPAPAPSLPNALSNQLSALHNLRTQDLPLTTRNLSNTLATHLATHTAYLSSLIRHLELHTHGAISRHTYAQASYLSAVAAGLESKIQILALQTRHAVYTPDVQRALQHYSTHLHDFSARLREREELVRDELEMYEKEGGEALRECARRYGGVLREIEEVKGEIRRLEPGK